VDGGLFEGWPLLVSRALGTAVSPLTSGRLELLKEEAHTLEFDRMETPKWGIET